MFLPLIAATWLLQLAFVGSPGLVAIAFVVEVVVTVVAIVFWLRLRRRARIATDA